MFKKGKNDYMVFVTGAAYDKNNLIKFYRHVWGDKDLLLLGNGRIDPTRVWSLFPSNPSDLQVLNLANYLFGKNYYISNIFTGIPYYNTHLVDSIALSFNPNMDFKQIKKYFDEYRRSLEDAVLREQEKNDKYIDYIPLGELAKIEVKETKISQESYKYRLEIGKLGIDEEWGSKMQINMSKTEKKIGEVPVQPYGGIMLLSYVLYMASKQKGDGKVKIFISSNNEGSHKESDEIKRFVIELAGDPQKIEEVQDKEKADITVTSVYMCCDKHEDTIDPNNSIRIPLHQILALPNPCYDEEKGRYEYYPLPCKNFKELLNSGAGNRKIFFIGGGEHNFAMLYFFNYFKWRNSKPLVDNTEQQRDLPDLAENWFSLLKKFSRSFFTYPEDDSSRFMNSTGGFVKTINGILHEREGAKPNSRGHSNRALLSYDEVEFHSNKLAVYRVYGISAVLTRISLYKLLVEIKEGRGKIVKLLREMGWCVYRYVSDKEVEAGHFYDSVLIRQWDEKDSYNNLSREKLKDVVDLLDKATNYEECDPDAFKK